MYNKKTKNIALIFAGGHGRRMNNAGKPKQFLELKGKPIIVYTLELFEKHKDIDAIIVACLDVWIPYLKQLIQMYNLTKVVEVVPGGETGQESIFATLKLASEFFAHDSIVLIHDGVRPLINEQTITDNIDTVRKYGSCITCVPAIETFVVSRDDGMLDIPERKDSLIARAPQSFILKDILKAHLEARQKGLNNFVDSCSLMNYCGHMLHTVIGPIENIKITTPMDYFIFKTMVEVNEVQQVFGI